MATLKRIQDLFRRGEIVVLMPRHQVTGEVLEHIPVYIAKLNALERDESIKDARAARARRILAYDRDPDEQGQIAVLLSSMTESDLHEDLLRRMSGELLTKAEDEVRSDPKWKERLEAIDRAAIADDGPTSAQEREILATLASEYQAAIGVVHQRFMRRHLVDLKATPREELEAAYRNAWRDMLGATTFHEERRQTEIWYALRKCTVELDEYGVPNESTLIVGDRLCPKRADVADLPDDVVEAVVRSLEQEMTSREAGNSVAPSASSGSSERQSTEEGSTPSTPTET